MNSIAESLNEIRRQLPDGVKLCAISKYHPSGMIRDAYAVGQRIFGESHVQELVQKVEELKDIQDIEWHFIGHLQTNKVKYIAPFISLIHSVDTPKLLREISKQGVKCGRKIPCLMQLHVAREETKFGFSPDELVDYLKTGEWKSLTGAYICGVMCMASNTDDEERIHEDFRAAIDFIERCSEEIPEMVGRLKIHSWGMSGDYRIAIEEKSTMIRIGTAIFGPRVY